MKCATSVPLLPKVKFQACESFMVLLFACLSLVPGSCEGYSVSDENLVYRLINTAQVLRSSCQRRYSFGFISISISSTAIDVLSSQIHLLRTLAVMLPRWKVPVSPIDSSRKYGDRCCN
ncbi:uncharacterized protein EV420DRAFT_1125998 [Desarmillaria tabescens]|uniref:Secreted protein n=1 Tax=Armillaria tabescens TaxID=1929756 RepID=A0AA39MNK4_ARMTA|nr:uncharacterized protein EV420DRAFT_1125998 [Desarmillaria tabescens]KAK0440912.1 hypothetical protein EV420DRAFT_1125998 [Desarmillaria tabescens]